ncbi:MAG: LPS export ABC transporter periplasmic protein LptC [Gammaproteobacteria bacterium]|nr:LPS export ABC transporter periplasmic protein LptC [Gammaproteobacteria bacterium]
MRSLSLQKLTISLLLGIAITLSVCSILFSKHNAVSNKDNPNQPDAFINQVVSTTFSRMGTPILIIQSLSMTHYANNDTTYIDKPHVIVFRRSPQPWKVDALHALATHGMHTIQFSDHVVVFHAADAEATTTTLLTEALTIFPETQQAQTNLPVTIKQPSTIMHGVGMLSNLKDGTIRLLSQTRGEYVPDA